MPAVQGPGGALWVSRLPWASAGLTRAGCHRPAAGVSCGSGDRNLLPVLCALAVLSCQDRPLCGCTWLVGWSN